MSETAMYLSIGDFSRMTHLSVKALRHYHDLGLLVPARIDPSSGYRTYLPAQVGSAQVIRRFRELGMPLEDVKAVMDAPDLDARNQAIVAHLERLEAQLAETRSAVSSLRQLLSGPTPEVEVEFRSVPATPSLAVRGRVRVDEFTEWWVATFAGLDEMVGAAGLAAAGPRGALYSGDFFEDEEGEVTAYVPVAGEIGPMGGGEILEIPAAELAVAVHRGTVHDLDRTYGALGAFVAQRAVGLAGPIREVYLVTYADTADEAAHRTEVCWPVFRTAPSVPLSGTPR